MGGPGRARLFQLPQGDDLRRLKRDPAQHSGQGGAGVLTAVPDYQGRKVPARRGRRRVSIETWLAFVAASAVLLVIPGPTILLVISYALGRGVRTALPVA